MRNYAGSAMMLVTTMVAAVGCYTINLKVSSERAGVESLRMQLVADAREMRNLQAELRTRARFPELQRWNDNVLQMSAPAAGQFLRSPVELAGYAAATTEAKPGIVYAVTTPEAAATVTAPLVTVAYEAAPAADAAVPRLIRAGYSVPQRSPAPAVELAAPVQRRAPLADAVQPERARLASPERAQKAPPERAQLATPERAQLATRERAQLATSERARLTPPERTEKARPERVQLARAEARPEARPPARPAEPRRPEPKKAAPVKIEPPRAEAPAPGAPIDLLPQGGQ